MAGATKNGARLNFRLAPELKHTIEEAAALTGQTVSDFTISVLVRSARTLIQEHDNTLLTNRDREAFIAAIDNTDAKPNKALTAAARRYKKQVG